MGVRGFTTYMSNHSHLFLEIFELKDCYLIVDGTGLAIQLYQWHTKSNDCFGGDYDKYANTVYTFFNLLKWSNVTPIILFDGGYEDRKLKTLFSRMRNRICTIKRLNSVTEGSIAVFPLLVKDIFEEIAMKQDITVLRNDYESDSEIACLARNLNCPILGFDSDFYFFNTLYIPFDTFEMKVVKRYNKKLGKTECSIPCRVYKVEKFLKHFGLDEEKLCLLPVLLGNDYVRKSLFSVFHKHIKLQKSKSGNEQQRLIKTVIHWLKHETLESAISKVLGRFKASRRKFISIKLNNAMKGYLQVNSTLVPYLKKSEQANILLGKENNIDILSIEATVDEDMGEEQHDADLFMESEEEIRDEFEQIGIKDNYCFLEKYRRCLLPRCFVDIKVRNTYFCMSQVEDFDMPHSHTICLDIISCMHKILTQPSCKKLVCVVRAGEKTVAKQTVPECKMSLPTYEEIQNLNESQCKQWIFKILGLGENFLVFLDSFPKDWHLFLIALNYWKKHSERPVDTSFIYSLILCAIVLSFVDEQIGFCRSYKKLQRMIPENKNDNESSNCESVNDILNLIDYNNSLACLKTLINYFHMETKMTANSKLFDVTVVDNFSQFQSCLLHLNDLNSLFNFPFENILASKFFSGTFLYNLTVNFRKRRDLKLYISSLLKDCPKVLIGFQKIVESMDEHFDTIVDSSAKKMRKRKKRSKECENEEVEVLVLDDEYFIDEENKYSVLQSECC